MIEKLILPDYADLTGYQQEMWDKINEIIDYLNKQEPKEPSVMVCEYGCDMEFIGTNWICSKCKNKSTGENMLN
jgi:hypothetical protein